MLWKMGSGKKIFNHHSLKRWVHSLIKELIRLAMGTPENFSTKYLVKRDKSFFLSEKFLKYHNFVPFDMSYASYTSQSVIT